MLDERPLRGDCGGDGIPGPGKGCEDAVSLGIDLGSAVRLDGTAEDAAIVGEDSSVALSYLSEQPGRPFEIGKQKGDSTGREERHGIIFPPLLGSPSEVVGVKALGGLRRS
jgi:hypothetical protein